MFGLFGKKENRDDALPEFKEMFLSVQRAVGDGNDQVLADLCTEDLYDFLMANKADNIRNRVKNVIENIEILNVFTVEAYHDDEMNQDFHVVRFQYNIVDYYINADGVKTNADGEVLEETPSQFVEESWGFTRRPRKPWIVASIESDSFED